MAVEGKICTFDTISLGDCILKISSLDNQILIHSINKKSLEYSLVVFIDEMQAFEYLEKL